MRLQNMFKKTKYISLTEVSEANDHKMYEQPEAGPEVPEGLLKKCNHCKSAILADDVKKGHYTCPKCQGYFRMHAMRRVELIADENTFEEWDRGIENTNPLGFSGYSEKLKQLQEKTGLDEAIVTGKAKIEGQDVVLGVCDGRFMMASMGYVVGEKIARAVERATARKLPVVIFACSGGARMQEGMVSLMQMTKTSAALKRHSDAGQLYISVLTDPTTGGVTASFAMLGDIILAEPNALIGFAGPRVIEQTIGQKLPKGFQRSEFLLEHGFIDRIVKREEMHNELAQILRLHTWTAKVPAAGSGLPPLDQQQGNNQIASAWDRVRLSRMKDRPVAGDYINRLFPDFVEMHGDRCYRDDAAVIGGVADFHGRPVTVIAQAKGRDTKENVSRNFGMPSPDGYRKALRLMKQAEKFGRTIICLVDTPGAFCGLEAEERGQGEVIARNLFEMSALTVPVLSIVIGEGGSGGALAMAVADEVWMLENSIYSILSPEGFASILWKDSKRAEEAAGVMKLTAADLKEMGIVERVFAEPVHYTLENLGAVCNSLELRIEEFIKQYQNMTASALTGKRYERFRAM